MIELTTTLYIVSVLLCSFNEYCTIQYILSDEVLHVSLDAIIVGVLYLLLKQNLLK